MAGGHDVVDHIGGKVGEIHGNTAYNRQSQPVGWVSGDLNADRYDIYDPSGTKVGQARRGSDWELAGGLLGLFLLFLFFYLFVAAWATARLWRSDHSTAKVLSSTMGWLFGWVILYLFPAWRGTGETWFWGSLLRSHRKPTLVLGLIFLPYLAIPLWLALRNKSPEEVSDWVWHLASTLVVGLPVLLILALFLKSVGVD